MLLKRRRVLDEADNQNWKNDDPARFHFDPHFVVDVSFEQLGIVHFIQSYIDRFRESLLDDADRMVCGWFLRDVFD